MGIRLLKNEDQGVFEQIFLDWWDEFKKKCPSYGSPQEEVKDWYNDHKTKKKKVETIPVLRKK